MSAALRELLAKAATDNPWGGPFDRQDAVNAILRGLPAMLDEVERMRAQRDGAIEQHGRDSAELRDLCAHRDTLKAALLAKSAAYDALVARVRDLAAGWSYEAINFVHGTNGAESRAMSAQKSACADELVRLLVSDDRPSHTAGEK